MYDSSKILASTGLYTRVGLKEPTKDGYTGILDSSAKATKSGNTYDLYHSLATFPNVYDCQADPAISNAEVNTLIASMQKEAIVSALSAVFSDKPDLIQNDLLFKNENSFTNKIANEGMFVGFELSLPASNDFLSVLNTAVLQFDTNKTFNLYLFHSSVKAAIATVSVTSVADSFAIVTLAKSMYLQTSTYGPGKFYLGYFQNDLGAAMAYDRAWNDSGIKTRFNCVGVRSIKATPIGITRPDVSTLTYCSESWGLNLNISSYHDYTNLIMDNQGLFDSVQGYAFAIRVLELIKTTGRINATQRVNEKLPDIATFDLADQGEPFKTLGMYTKMKIEVNRIRKSLFNDTSIII